MREALEQHGYQCVPQVGVDGFFIDLGVLAPTKDRFILGIECDGASYHSSKSARDRDKLRQKILEDLGWTIHRVWSTDWFRNPKHQIARMLQVLSKLSASSVELDAKVEQTAVRGRQDVSVIAEAEIG